MKPRVKKNRLRSFLILVVMFLIPLETAFAQDNAGNVAGSAHMRTRKTPDTGMPQKNGAKPELEITDGDLLLELVKPEPVKTSDQTVQEDSCINNRCASDIPKSE